MKKTYLNRTILLFVSIFFFICHDDLSACDPFTKYKSGNNNYFLPNQDFKGNAECFDQVMRGIPANSIITLGPGIYPTHGCWNLYSRSRSAGFMPKSGWRIRGQGITRTKLQLVNIDSNGYNFIFGSPQAWAKNPKTNGFVLRKGLQIPVPRKELLVSNIEIRGMTLDCAGPQIAKLFADQNNGNKNVHVGAVNLFGHNIHLLDIRIINAISQKRPNGVPQNLAIISLKGHPYTLPQRDEVGFPVSPKQLAFVSVRKVILDSFKGGLCTGIEISGETQALVENCRINFAHDRSRFPGNGGGQSGLSFGGRGTFNVVFRKNYIHSASRGITTDSGPNARIILKDNSIRNCDIGISLSAVNGGRVHEQVANGKGIVYSEIEHNTITLKPRKKTDPRRIGIGFQPRVKTQKAFNHPWSGAYGIHLKNNYIYNGENESGRENWGIQIGVFPGNEKNAEYWSHHNIFEGNRFYDNKAGEPLYNVIASAPHKTDSNGSAVMNTISKESPNYRYSMQGEDIRTWKPNGFAAGSKEVRASALLLKSLGQE